MREICQCVTKKVSQMGLQISGKRYLLSVLVKEHPYGNPHHRPFASSLRGPPPQRGGSCARPLFLFIRWDNSIFIRPAHFYSKVAQSKASPLGRGTAE